jgi:hypothetical protein
MDETLKVGDKVKNKSCSGGPWEGIVLAVFKDIAGEQRIVVEYANPFNGNKHVEIYWPELVDKQ